MVLVFMLNIYFLDNRGIKLNFFNIYSICMYCIYSKSFIFLADIYYEKDNLMELFVSVSI